MLSDCQCSVCRSIYGSQRRSRRGVSIPRLCRYVYQIIQTDLTRQRTVLFPNKIYHLQSPSSPKDSCLWPLISNMALFFCLGQGGREAGKSTSFIPIAPLESCLQVQPPSISSTYRGRCGSGYWRASAKVSILVQPLPSPLETFAENHFRETFLGGQVLILSLSQVGRCPVEAQTAMALNRGWPGPLALFSHWPSRL